MATSYTPIFEKFYKLLVNDTEFFNYKGLVEDEIKQLIEDHSIALLDKSISMIYDYGKPDINLLDKDDALKQFKEDLVIKEINLLPEIMYYKYFEEGRNKLKKLGLTFKSSELNLFSPAADRDSFMKMVNNLKIDTVNKINNYLARDRNTWEYKSIYGGS